MQFDNLKKETYEANMLLQKYKLVIHTWGNVSVISSDKQYFAIKPSGVEYNNLKWQDIVVLDLKGNKVSGNLNPSSDTPTHMWLYNNFKHLKSIVHTHSPYAVAWASIGISIPCYSTTHADNFYGPILCTRDLSKKEITDEYELNTGKVITESFKDQKINPRNNAAVIVKSHGPFVWSYTSAKDAVDLALTLEEIAKISTYVKSMLSSPKESEQYIQDKHYFRKHGSKSYYGQKN